MQSRRGSARGNPFGAGHSRRELDLASGTEYPGSSRCRPGARASLHRIEVDASGCGMGRRPTAVPHGLRVFRAFESARCRSGAPAPPPSPRRRRRHFGAALRKVSFPVCASLLSGSQSASFSTSSARSSMYMRALSCRRCQCRVDVVSVGKDNVRGVINLLIFFFLIF